jgi:hypothetical protein
LLPFLQKKKDLPFIEKEAKKLSVLHFYVATGRPSSRGDGP